MKEAQKHMRNAQCALYHNHKTLNTVLIMMIKNYKNSKNSIYTSKIHHPNFKHRENVTAPLSHRA